MKKYLVYCILAVILVTGFGLRYDNYTVWPREGATFDEFAWTFLGLSIWQKGIPTSWSPHAAYTHRVEYFNPQGAHFTLVTPYLEHPPLFGLIAGGFARLRGITSFDQVNVSVIRPLALVLGVLAIFTVFLLASAVYGDIVGLIAAGVYAVTPTVAIGSRLVQNENFFIPFFLLALYFAYKYVKRSNTKDLVATTILCALLPLAKVPWVAAPVAVIAMFAFSKKWKVVWTVGITTVICFSGYILYGFLLDKELFLNLWRLQLSRYAMSFDSIYTVFRDPLVVDRTFVDGWIYFGWAAMIVLLTKDSKKNVPVILGFLSYLAIFVFAIPSEALHGWYRYPFYPFLAISIAVFLNEYLNRNYFIMATFYLMTGLSMFAESWGKVLGFSYPVFRTYLTTVAIGALPGLFPELKRYKLFQWINIILVCVVILLSVWAIRQYNEQ
jgi:4-amino-4-deoxy-L-arabinose transferase-like glycosyltransferase